MTPSAAAQRALQPIAQHYPSFLGALVCLAASEEYGAATYNMPFQLSVRADGMEEVRVEDVPDMKSSGTGVYGGAGADTGV
jgi:hypothetical protein